MKIKNLTQRSRVYTSNVYMLTGNWNTLDDLNTLIDVGRDHSIIDEIKTASTGVGKKRVEQVIITHSHYDHASLLPYIKQEFNPLVYAYSTTLNGVDCLLEGNEVLRVGENTCQVIYTPGHSSDSICLYCPEDKVLFAGDTPLIITTPDYGYEEAFIIALEEICHKDIHIIFFGHGNPLTKNCNYLLKLSLANLEKSVVSNRTNKKKEEEGL